MLSCTCPSLGTFLLACGAELRFPFPMTFSAQTSCSPCLRLRPGLPTAQEGSQLLPVPAHTWQIQPDHSYLQRLPSASSQHPGPSEELPWAVALGLNQGHTVSWPQGCPSPKYTIRGTSVPQDHCPSELVRHPAPQTLLALPSIPAVSFSTEGLGWVYVIRKISLQLGGDCIGSLNYKARAVEKKDRISQPGAACSVPPARRWLE